MNTIGILYVHSPTSEEDSQSTVEYLADQIKSLHFSIEEITYVQDSEQILSKKLDTFVKQFDLIVVVSDFKNNTVFKALAKICGEVPPNSQKSTNKFNDYRSEWCNTCDLPAAVKLLSDSSLKFPVIYFQRIYILKEEYLQEQFTKVLRDHLRVYRQKQNYSKVIKIKNHVYDIHAIAKQLKTTISTHITQSDDQIVQIKVESTSIESIVEYEIMLKKQLNEGYIEGYQLDESAVQIYQSKEAHIRQAIDSIEECLRKYGAENIFLSFNGGKDCTVLLHLYNIVLKIKYPEFKNPIFCSYVKNGETFPEQTEFIRQCEVYFNLEIEESAVNMKENLVHILQTRPNLKACLMGTRRTDPYSAKLDIFQLTDPDWPQIMRVSPLLEWHYSDIWDYLLFYKVPYCKLYDNGYTSLGDVSNTVRNPALKYYDEKSNSIMYLPAYKLMDESQERVGRNKII